MPLVFILFPFPSPLFFFLQLHRMHDLFIVGSGEAVLQLVPPAQCQRHCQSLATPLEPGDIGRWGPGGKVSRRICVVFNSETIVRIKYCLHKVSIK